MNPDRIHTQVLKGRLAFVVLLAADLGLATLGPDDTMPQDGATPGKMHDTRAAGSRPEAVEHERPARVGEVPSP